MTADIVITVVLVVVEVEHRKAVVDRRRADNKTSGRSKDNYLTAAHDTWNKMMC